MKLVNIRQNVYIYYLIFMVVMMIIVIISNIYCDNVLILLSLLFFFSGVFYCGDRSLEKELKRLSQDFSYNTSTRFVFHKENF